MHPTILLFIASALVAQTVHFAPQPSNLPGADQYAVTVCQDGKATNMSAGKVYEAAISYDVSPLTNSTVLDLGKRATKNSMARKVALVLEVAGGLATGFMVGGIIDFEEPWIKATIPSIPIGLRTITTLTSERIPHFDLPDNMLPPMFQVPEAGCTQSYTLYVFKGDAREAFSVTLK